MPVAYTYDPKTNIVRARPTGVISVSDIEDYFRRITEDPAVASGFLEIAYFDGVEDFAFRFSQAHRILHAYKAMVTVKSCSGTVFVASSPLAIGIARMLSAVGEEAREMRVVRSEEELREEIAKRTTG